MSKKAAAIAVFNPFGELLVGLTHEGTYCVPGGGVAPKEDPKMGAIRELFEETGIYALPEDVGTLCVKTNAAGVEVHCFITYIEDVVSLENDPDREFQKLLWVNLEDGLPGNIKNNLKHKDDFVLSFIGLTKSEEVHNWYVQQVVGYLSQDELEKGLKSVLAGMAAGALLGAPAKISHIPSPAKETSFTHENSSLPTDPSNSSPYTPGEPASPIKNIPWNHGMTPELHAIAGSESSWGKNVNHAPHSKGWYHTAHGSVGLKPVTAHEDYLRSSKLKASFPGLQDAQTFTNKFHTDTGFYNTVANHHWNRLKGHFGGNASKTAYAWRWGIGAAGKASDEQVNQDDYVQKFHKNLGKIGHLVTASIEKSEESLEKSPVEWEASSDYFRQHLVQSPEQQRLQHVGVTHIGGNLHIHHYHGAEIGGNQFQEHRLHFGEDVPGYHDKPLAIVRGTARPESFKVSASAANPEFSGKGYGRLIYKFLAQKHKKLVSDDLVSGAASRVYEKLSESPGFKLKIGKPMSEESHVLTYTEPKVSKAPAKKIKPLKKGEDELNEIYPDLDFSDQNLLHQMATEWAPEHRDNVTLHADLPEQTIDHVINMGDYQHQKNLLANTNSKAKLNSSHINKLFEDPGHWLALATEVPNKLDDEHIQKLMDIADKPGGEDSDAYHAVVSAISSRPWKDSTVNKALLHPNEGIKYATVLNQSLTQDQLSFLERDPSIKVQNALAHKHASPEQLTEMLSQGKGTEGAIQSENFGLKPEHFDHFLAAPILEDEVKAKALHHWGIPPEKLEEFVKNTPKQNLALHGMLSPNINESLFNWVLYYGSDNEITQILSNPNTNKFLQEHKVDYLKAKNNPAILEKLAELGL
jgi:8-oxo-dGTP pyrophosphatase MutT (NUDIX family)